MCMCISLLSDKLDEIHELALSLWTQLVTVCWIMSFLNMANFVPMASHYFSDGVGLFRMTF